MSELLSILEIREFVSDYSQNNYLLDKEEFSDTFITLCRDLAVSSYNEIPPMSITALSNFPSKSTLLWGTLYHMFSGKAALYARNQMSYSDGGIQIPVEEKYETYDNLAKGAFTQFQSSAAKIKVYLNMSAGWGSVSSDDASLPYF
jgi:hypothetical protein